MKSKIFESLYTQEMILACKVLSRKCKLKGMAVIQVFGKSRQKEVIFKNRRFMHHTIYSFNPFKLYYVSSLISGNKNILTSLI